MAVTLHALTRKEDQSRLPRASFRNARLFRVATRRITALYTNTETPTDTREDADAEMSKALFHHELLTQSSLDCDILPVRFGTVFSGVEALKKNLNENTTYYETCLARTAGRLECAFHITTSAQAPSQTSNSALNSSGRLTQPRLEASGRSYLARRRALRDERQRSASQRAHFIESALATCQEFACQLAPGLPNSDRLLDVSVLLERARVPEFARRVADMREECRGFGLEVSMLGPWPAYSFCAGPEEAAAPTAQNAVASW